MLKIITIDPFLHTLDCLLKGVDINAEEISDLLDPGWRDQLLKELQLQWLDVQVEVGPERLSI